MSEEELNEAMQYNLDYTEAMLSDELFGTNEVAEVKLLASEKTIKDLQQKVEQLEKENIKQNEIIENLTTMTVCGDKKQIKNTAQYKLEQLENIRKEAIEYIKEHARIDDEYPSYIEMLLEEKQDLLNILNKGDNNGK